MANVEHYVKNTTKTKFRIGSVTKQFTAMAVLILQEQKKLRVEDKVEDHVSDVPDQWKQITIHQLLTHTSGIMHSWSLDKFGEICSVPQTPDEALRLFHDQPLLFEPGRGFHYSGVGYFLLAKIIREVSGMKFGAFLQREIFSPLGMKSTGVDTPEVMLEHRASGYVVNADGGRENAYHVYIPILTGGGNLYSTVEDLARWGTALADKELISESSYQDLYKVERDGYAYGWRVSEQDGQTMVSHLGGISGFAARVVQFPEQNVFVAMLSNLVDRRMRQAMSGAQEMIMDDLQD